MRILHVVGARPNLVKMAPLIAALRDRVPGWPSTIVHTGQHYDRMMSEVFIEELGVPEPDHVLGVGSASHPEQIARVLERLEPVLHAERPDLVVVPGDVNSTLGADHLSELCFLHCDEAIENLRAEGIEEARMKFVGNTMIDTLVALEERIRERGAAADLGLEPGGYLLVTLHRPALVDGPLLHEAMKRLDEVGHQLPVVFPVHPRTRKMLDGGEYPDVILTDPVGYLDFLSLEAAAAAVLTDSGGIQEETTYLGIPCFTLRDNTERPVTVRAGTNTLLGLDPARIAEIPDLLRDASGRTSDVPELWDGRAAERAADVIAGW